LFSCFHLFLYPFVPLLASRGPPARGHPPASSLAARTIPTVCLYPAPPDRINLDPHSLLLCVVVRHYLSRGLIHQNEGSAQGNIVIGSN
jgi:hypothetical protein